MSARRRESVPPPALGIVRLRRVTNKEIAEQLGWSPGWVTRVLLGHEPAPVAFQTGLAELLCMPASELFASGGE